jgi:hypothetical protein
MRRGAGAGVGDGLDVHGQRVLSSYTQLHDTAGTQQLLIHLLWWAVRVCVFFLAFARLLAMEPVVSADSRQWAEVRILCTARWSKEA